MEEIRRVEAAERSGGRGPSMAEMLRPEMTFLAENPEAFGLIPDACPLATKHLLIAANGRGAESGAAAPAYEMEHPGVEGLFEFYGDLIPRTRETEDALQFVFGESRTLRELPVSRYCAALAEIISLQVMNGPANGASYEQTILMLNDKLRQGLTALQGRFGELEHPDVLWDEYFELSIGICRIRPAGDGDYVADIFSSGDFRIYLLDEQGMAPLWTVKTELFSPGHLTGLAGKSLRFRHPEPFAILLVSEGICALNAAEARSMRNDPGLVWRYRMRLEDYFLRLITDCVREYEFGDRATRFFVGRSHGRDSASGALTILRDGVAYETFRLHCQNRLSSLERQMELLPNGYDPHNVPPLESRARTEIQFIRELLERSHELSDRTANALRLRILKKFEEGDTAELTPFLANVPEYRRLDVEEMRRVFLCLDRENTPDRTRIEKNRNALREGMAEHWITLRPFLLNDGDTASAALREHRGVSEEIYRVCLDMNRRLAEMLAERRRTVQSIQQLMAESLEVAAAEGNDWACCRAGNDSVKAWLDPLQNRLPALLESMGEGWQAETERYRSLLAAYTAERDKLFRRDIHPEYGAFAADWQAILEGRLSEDVWSEWRDCLSEKPGTAGFGDFLDALRRVSLGTGALLERIRSRAAENRMARELANRPDLRIDALRGAAYEDPDWGEEIISVMDTATRNEFRATVRRWQETCLLRERQKMAYEEYAAMYAAYESCDDPRRGRTL